MYEKSVGMVETEYYHLEDDLQLESGERLRDVTIAYETYGCLNQEKSNAVLVCHALSGDAHVAGWHKGETKPGWWDIVIGPGKALDTEKYFVICSNIIGGCKGTTGPSSTNPETGRPYGLSFPVITISDIVKAEKTLVENLGIQQLFAVIGGSMGGFQVLEWCVSYPEMVRLAIPIATSAYSSSQQIAFNEVGRRAIISDPNWNKGDYYDKNPPNQGLALARMIGHITYLSDRSMHERFGRRLQDKERYAFDIASDFQVESYLHHQGYVFTKRFDANSYLYITKAIDYFDLTRNGSLIDGFKGVRAKFLVISVTSDWLYPPYQSQEIVEALRSNGADVTYCEIKSNYGHDAFLLEAGQLNYVIGSFLSLTQVKDVMVYDAPTIREGSTIEEAARLMMEKEATHLPVISQDRTLVGIVTAWDISKAVAMKLKKLDEIMTRNVVTSKLNEPIQQAAEKMEENKISALPIIDDQQKVIGMLTSEELTRLVGMHR